MEGKAYSERLSEFLDFIHRVDQGYPAEVERLRETDDQTNDILHSLELETHSAPELIRLAVQLREVRRERRLAKDNIEMLKPFNDWILSNRGPINKLRQVLGEERKTEKYIADRAYYYRTDIVDRTLRKENESNTEDGA